jgi:glycosyltransferase involved in cell wall biosynthesis
VQDPPVEPRAADAGGWRQRLGLPADAVLIGITARIQPHRRFDLLWQVARRVADVEPRARFVLLGRGNPADTQALVTGPIERLRLRERVLLPGYLYEPEYGQALASLDLSLFLVPGSDGTCRAVREAMALGVPVVATRRGIRPELLAEGGVVTDEAPEPLAAALLMLIRDPGLAQRLGQAGRQRARTRMDPAAAAERLFRFYRQLGELPS